jgi:hypothetical protein
MRIQAGDVWVNSKFNIQWRVTAISKGIIYYTTVTHWDGSTQTTTHSIHMNQSDNLFRTAKLDETSKVNRILRKYGYL